MTRLAVLLVVVLAGTATGQPARHTLDSITIDARNLAKFVVGPEHAQVRWVNVHGCGTLADLVPLRGLPAGVEIKIGQNDCLTVAKLDGVEAAGEVHAFAIVRDVSALARATHLKRLRLHNGPLPIAGLAKLQLPSLTGLDLNLLKNSPADMKRLLSSPLVADLFELTMSVPGVPVLPSLPKLQRLYLSMYPADTKRADLGFLRSVPNVRKLEVGGVEQADLAPILALAELDTLDIGGLCRVDARPLANMPKLERVQISLLVEEAHKPVRAGLVVHRTNPYALCSPKRP